MKLAWVGLGFTSIVAFWLGFANISNPDIGIVFLIAIGLLIAAIIDFVQFLKKSYK